MSWTDEELELLRRDKNLSGFEHIYTAKNVAPIEASGQHRVVRAVSRVRLFGLVEAAKVQELKAELLRLCLSHMLIEDDCLAEIEDVRPLSPSPALEMVMDEDGEYRPFVTCDSVEEVLLMNGADEVVARSQATMFMKGLVFHVFSHHEKHKSSLLSKFKTSPCDCPLTLGSARRPRAFQPWEVRTIAPDAFQAFAALERQDIKDAINLGKGEWEFVSFGPKRIRLLKDIAIRIRSDLDSDMEKQDEI